MVNVLIVDDEKNIREGIKALIDWESCGASVVGDCVNGRDALDFIERNEVDIVVTDIKMPVMDGLELSHQIYEKYRNIEVIVLTAFSEFEMVRKALKCGVSDFIIKNEFMSELPGAILKCKEKIEARGITTEDDDIFFSILKSLCITGEVPAKSVEKFGLMDYNFCICNCSARRYDDKEKDRDIVEVLNNILKISLLDCRYTIMPMSEKFLVIGVCYKKNSGIDLHRVVGYFSNILIMIEEFMRVDVKLGISTEITSVDQLENGYRQAREALAKLDGGGCELKVYDGNIMSKGGDFIDINWHTQKISEATFDERQDVSGDLIESFCTLLKESDCSFEQCRLYVLVIYSSLIHKAVRYQINTDLDFNEYEKVIYRKVNNSNTIYDLEEVGKEITSTLRQLCIGKKNVKNELVTKVDECIREMYSSELTLQNISNQLFLNGSYISRTYKKMTGITVTEAITLYRVSKAKELLANSNLKIYEIAQAVGFNDAAYFTNVFYKYTKISPSDYRQFR